MLRYNGRRLALKDDVSANGGMSYKREAPVSDMPSNGPIVDLTPDEVKQVPSAGATQAPESATPAPETATPPPEAAPQPPAKAAPPLPPPAGVRVTFKGNTYDLTAFASVVSGVLVLASCLTCNTLFYCLPLVPIVLGLIGVVSANQSVDARRTRNWSWVGIAAGIFMLAMLLLAIVLYIAFIVLMIYLGNYD
jgi:hypothetical protein